MYTELQPRLGLIEARHSHSWSQEQIADKIGTTPRSVSQWERGSTRPSLFFRLKLCELFSKTEQDLDLKESDTQLSELSQALKSSAYHPLRMARIERGWTQIELADKLGTTIKSVSRWELDVVDPSLRFKKELCEVFGKTAQELGFFVSISDETEITQAASNEESIENYHPLRITHIPNKLLQEARLSRRWSQQNLADQVLASYISVNRWEQGTVFPSAYFRIKLCALFSKDAEELGFFDNPVNPVREAIEQSSMTTGSVGTRIKILRIKHKLGQSRLAGEIGVSERTVVRWEQDKTLPYLIYQQRLCALFGVDAEVLGFVEDQVELTNVDQCSENDGIVPNRKLSRQRKVRGWTQRDVAEKVSTYVVNVSRWERGETIPDEAFQQKLCELFQKTGEELGFTGS